MIDQDICIGCGTCVQLCPVNAISFNKDGKAQIDKEKCIKCGTCEVACPVSAIKIEN